MKVRSVVSYYLLVIPVVATTNNVFQPTRVAFDDLVKSHNASLKSVFIEALKTSGILSVTGLPESISK
jgi:hypothetical protein